jgi:Na+/H+-dicarboxylate symporter/ABC-type amino acid transport substrate-binding protein
MNFSKKIFVGLFLGLAVGIFFGELASPLKIFADGFVKLLQMTVLPYMTVSIISSLGSLSISEAKSLGLRAGIVLLVLWAIGLLFCFLFPVVFPKMEMASFFSTTMVEKPVPFDVVNLFIPANPFHSLANSVVPAVVLFSVLLGIAMIGIERKQVLLDVLKVLSQGISRVTRFVVGLTPYGIFAIAASVAGTLNLQQLERIQIYLLIYTAVALLLTIWVLPGLVSALTSIKTGEILAATRDALVVAFMAGDLLIVLPTLTEMSEKLLRTRESEDSQYSTLPEVIIPTSFNFPHVGKLLSLSFVLFAGWFTDSSIPIAKYPLLALTGLITFFGSLNAAIPYLLDLFRIPADSFQLFLATSVLNSRFGTLLAVMHTVVVALLGSCAVAGKITWQPARLLRYALITAVLVIITFGGARLIFNNTFKTFYDQDQIVMNMKLLLPAGDFTVLKSKPLTHDAGDFDDVLDRIRTHKALHVCYEPDHMPYSYFNRQGELVGFDVEMAHRLTQELNVRAIFTPIDVMTELEERLADETCDIVMSGVAVTTRRAARMNFSVSYLDETMAFVVPDHLRNQFLDWDTIKKMGRIPIAVPNIPYYLDKMKQQLPEAQIIPINSFDQEFSSGNRSFQVAVFGAERASVYSLLHPEYSVVVPGPTSFQIPLAYPLAGKDESWVNFVDTWIMLKQKDKTIEELYDYWILGRNATQPKPRWSIIRNVLGWVK